MSEWKREDFEDGPYFTRKRRGERVDVEADPDGIRIEVSESVAYQGCGHGFTITPAMLAALGYTRLTDAEVLRRAAEIYRGITTGGAVYDLLNDAADILERNRGDKP